MLRTLVVNALRLVGKRTAMGHFIEYMAYYWDRMDIPFDRVLLMSPSQATPNQLDAGGQGRVAVHVCEKGWPLPIWEQIILPHAARGAAMLFCPSYTGPVLYDGRMVVANHGIYAALPGEFSWWKDIRTLPLYRLTALRADRVIANSHQTRDDLVNYFKLSPAKIDVVYPAAHPRFFEPQNEADIHEAVVQALGQRAPYILFVGKLSRRRNVPNLIEAFARVRQRQNLPHHLLIVGPNLNDTPVAELAEKHGVADAVRHHPYLTQEQLARLYAGAEVYALPTTYEGISWTMLEAMASGVAVLTVEHPTLAEGGGEAAFAVPSPAVDDLADGLTALLTQPDVRHEYARRGRAAAERFSWQAAAKATMAILDQVASLSDRRSARSSLLEART